VFIHETKFSDNESGDAGGGLSIGGGEATVQLTSFFDNTAVNRSGALYNETGQVTIIKTAFRGNEAPNCGAICNSNGTMTLANSTITGNTSTSTSTSGTGVVENNGGSAALTITNSTISGNTGNSGGGVVNGRTLNLYNTILANSFGGVFSNVDCVKAGLGTVSGHHNLIETDSAGVNACGTTSPIHADPKLGALAGSRPYLPLNTGSPAIDAGDNAVCAAAPVNNEDQNNAARPVDGDGDGSVVCDIGAHEAPQVNPTSTPTRTPTRTNTPTSTPTATATTDACAGSKPTKPKLLKPKKNGFVVKPKAKLDWSDATCAVEYKVQVKNRATGKSVFKTTVAAPKSLVKTGALPPGSYLWFVKACNSVKCVKSSKFFFTKQ
jgi:hypothetical protein